MKCAEKYLQLNDELRQLAGDRVKLLPVSKTVGAGEIMALYDLGVRDFGENRIEVLKEKAETLPVDIRWHFIGRLQSNKVRKILKLASVIHSVDSVDMLERIDRIAGEENVHPEVFLEISVSGEECKGGFPAAEAELLVQSAIKCRNISVSGLMTMAPLAASGEECRGFFTALRECRDRLEKNTGISLPELSMGMSNDWREAVESGSTIIRVGSTIFRDE